MIAEQRGGGEGVRRADRVLLRLRLDPVRPRRLVRRGGGQEALRRLCAAGPRPGAGPEGRAFRRHAGQRHGDPGRRRRRTRRSAALLADPVRPDARLRRRAAAGRRHALRGQGRRQLGRAVHDGRASTPRRCTAPTSCSASRGARASSTTRCRCWTDRPRQARGGMGGFNFGAGGLPKPGEGPSREERETGFYDILLHRRRSATAAPCAPRSRATWTPATARPPRCWARAPSASPATFPATATPGGCWTSAAAMDGALIRRLQAPGRPHLHPGKLKSWNDRPVSTDHASSAARRGRTASCWRRSPTCRAIPTGGCRTRSSTG